MARGARVMAFRSHWNDYDFIRRPLAVFRNAPLHWNARPSTRRHIFIMGPPRSGTTLLQNILLHHSRINGPDEETSFFLRRRFDTLRLRSVSADVLEDIVNTSRSKVEIFDRISELYVGGNGGCRFLEKSAEHSMVLERMLKYFPNSCFLFMYRDGRDSFVSARRYQGMDRRVIDRYPFIWRDCMRNLARNAGNPNILPVKYEDFCENAPLEFRRILEHLGLEAEDDLLSPCSYSRNPVSDAENFKRLREPISPQTVGVHQRQEHREDVAFFERVAATELRRFGYAQG